MPERQIQIRTSATLWPLSWPMGLTFLRLLLLPVFLWAILDNAHRADRTQNWLALGVFVVMAITDKLDGYLARRLNQTSKLGAVLDPVADKLLVACSVIVLNFDWIAPPHFAIPGWVVIAVYAKDLIVAVGTITLLAMVGTVIIRPRPLGKASTAIQLSLVIAVLLAPRDSARWFAFWHGFVRVLWWSTAAVAAAACVDYVLEGVRQLSRARAASVVTEKT